MKKPPRTHVYDPSIPIELRDLPQWVCWRYVLKHTKWTKIPFQPNGTAASTIDPDTWCAFSVAFEAYQHRQSFDGIGFVFSPDDPFAGIDIDNCLDNRGNLKAWTLGLWRKLPKVAYCEISPSGTGIKAWTRATLPDNAKHKAVVEDGHLEAYDHARYFTTTGTWYAGEIDAGQAIVDSIVDCYLKTKPATTQTLRRPTGQETRTADAIIGAIRRSKQAPKFDKLFRGNWQDYKVGHEGASRADEALCCIVAFWTQDPAAIDAIFRQSELMRPKWDEIHYADGRTYGQGTIDFALTNLRETINPKRQNRRRNRTSGYRHAQGRFTRR